ncbi:MAG: hypothetical protein PHX43_04350 [Alphaproteobacteria bacterium]|nr:hypothetical protein [Alphaproteobacteria bacterium]
MNDNHEINPMEVGLGAVAHTSKVVAVQLRAMAAGEGQYFCFAYMSPWVRNILSAAADIIEEYDRAA